MATLDIQIQKNTGFASITIDGNKIEQPEIEVGAYQDLYLKHSFVDLDGNAIDLSGEHLTWGWYIAYGAYNSSTLLDSSLILDDELSDIENGIVCMHWIPDVEDVEEFFDEDKEKNAYCALYLYDSLNETSSVMAVYTLNLQNVVYVSTAL